MSTFARSLSAALAGYGSGRCIEFEGRWYSGEDIAGYIAGIERALRGLGPGEPVALVGWRVSANFLDTAGEPMYMSRSFTPEGSQKANVQVVVLSHRLWKTQFGGDPRIIDKKITPNVTPRPRDIINPCVARS